MSEEPKLINYETLRKLEHEMEDAFDEIYQSIFESIQSSIDQLLQHPTDQNEITRIFHSIKSPAASLGAEQLAKLAAKLESDARRGVINHLKLDAPIKAIQQSYVELKKSLKEHE
jgi:HPt (histidine-containing phosphotransfer) domain-containing protein